jgi:hypothetical protein
VCECRFLTCVALTRGTVRGDFCLRDCAFYTNVNELNRGKKEIQVACSELHNQEGRRKKKRLGILGIS